MKDQKKMISKYDRLQAIINIATIFLGIIVVGIVFYGGIFKILNSDFPIDSFIVKKYLSCYIVMLLFVIFNIIDVFIKKNICNIFTALSAMFLFAHTFRICLLCCDLPMNRLISYIITVVAFFVLSICCFLQVDAISVWNLNFVNKFSAVSLTILFVCSMLLYIFKNYKSIILVDCCFAIYTLKCTSNYIRLKERKKYETI